MFRGEPEAALDHVESDGATPPSAAASGSPRNRMVFPKTRAVVAGLLFLAWIGYLASLVVETRGRILVSAPQLRNADVVVVAAISDEGGLPGGAIEVKQVLYPPNVNLAPALFVPKLALISPKTGWRGAGDYVVPLSNNPVQLGAPPEVALVPMSPGYNARRSEASLELGENPDEVVRVLSESTGVPADRLRQLADGQTLTVVNLPLPSHPARDSDEGKAVEKWRAALHAAGARNVTLRPGEAKIYPATPDVVSHAQAILQQH